MRRSLATILSSAGIADAGRARRAVLVRVFCALSGNRVIILLGGYDKLRDPSAKRQQREIAAEVAARWAVGEAVARARKASGLTQVQLAQAASIQQAEVSRIERGHSNPTVSTLARIAQTTGSRLELVAMGERSV